MAVDLQARGLRITAPDDDTVLDLAPIQGLWTEEQYLKLTDHSRRLIEFSDGSIEVLSMPTDKHQAISQYMFLALLDFVGLRGGRVRYAPLRVRIREGRFREPDILLVLDANDPRRQDRYWLGADVAVCRSVGPAAVHWDFRDIPSCAPCRRSRPDCRAPQRVEHTESHDH